MSKSKSRPTDSELQILSVLWQRGPSTVRDVYNALGKRSGYTTVLKLLQIMVDKGLVERDETNRSHIYLPVSSAAHTQRQIVRHLLKRAFAGSAKSLIMQVLAAKRTSPEELAEIRLLLKRHEKERS